VWICVGYGTWTGFSYNISVFLIHSFIQQLRHKGKQWVSLSSAENGSLVTSVTRINATVMYVPHLLVFSRSNVKAELLDSVPPGSTAACHRAGGSRKIIFTQWLNILSVL